MSARVRTSMMRMRLSGVLCGIAMGVVIGWPGALPRAQAEEIRLKSGSTLTGSVLDKNTESVILRVPRTEIVTVDGQPLPPPIGVGTRVPTMTVTDLGGHAHTVPDATRPTLVKFWATWCPHCRADIPLMKDIFATYHDRLQIVAASTDANLDRLRVFVEREQLPYPVVVGTAAPNASEPSLAQRYDVDGIPAYYLIASDGMVIDTWAGSFTEGHTNLREILDRLLSTAPSAQTSDASAHR